VNANRAARYFGIFWPGAGFLVGAWIGYLLRPSAFLVGQLPLEIVITGGTQLSGLDSILVPLARQSLGMLIAGGVIGAGAGLAYQLSRGSHTGKQHEGNDGKTHRRRPTKTGRRRPSQPAMAEDALLTSEEILTNRGILDLVSAGMGEATIVDKIHQSECDFDLATTDLIELKSRGVTEGILSAMLRRSPVRNEAVDGHGA
jgi:hypothetical protein